MEGGTGGEVPVRSAGAAPRKESLCCCPLWRDRDGDGDRTKVALTESPYRRSSCGIQ